MKLGNILLDRGIKLKALNRPDLDIRTLGGMDLFLSLAVQCGRSRRLGSPPIERGSFVWMQSAKPKYRKIPVTRRSVHLLAQLTRVWAAANGGKVDFEALAGEFGVSTADLTSAMKLLRRVQKLETEKQRRANRQYVAACGADDDDDDADAVETEPLEDGDVSELSGRAAR